MPTDTGATPSVNASTFLAAPKVSVCMITYNHAPYIGQAIESVLAQRAPFSVELVIGEDCSPDNTRAIIAEYQQRFPGRIRLVTSDHNVGMQPNFIRTYKACSGQYVAMLEGDDYWTDPYKLRDQVALLEEDLTAVMCFAGCAEVSEQGEIINPNFVPPAFRHRLHQVDIVRDYCPPTLSVLFRNRVLPEFPAVFAEVKNGDYFLFVMLSEYGTAVYLPRVVAHYRRHGGGVWSAQNKEQQFRSNLKTKLAMLRHFKGRYRKSIMPTVNWYYVQLLSVLWQQGRHTEFWSMYKDFAGLSFTTLNKELLAFTLKLISGRLSPSALLNLPAESSLEP